VPYYTEPLSVFSPNGVTVLETAEQLIELFTPVLEDMNTQGYSHMEAVEMNAKTLGENLAIVSNVVVRYKKDGSELNRTAGTYLVHKNSQGWKIGSLVMGDADKVIRF
jgi:ketosteroid isomerase-like protein